ncbi:substrate-binding domain-containing protein, partial [Kibdelosporangium lantanae]
DDYAGARMAARHVVELGHRDIGVVSLLLMADGHQGPPGPQRRKAAHFQVTADRLTGYLDVLPKDPPIWEAPDSRREYGRSAAHWLLTQTPRPTALLCMSDELALGALRAASDLGLVVPTDLTIVGFDDTPAAAWADLTTVRQDLLEKGRTTGDLVLRLLEGQTPTDIVTIGVALVTRGTSGPTPPR